jgi:hypothetical protein
MSLCSGIRADGGRCRAQAIGDSLWCFNHHPDYEEARRRRASRGGKRGGRGRTDNELTALKVLLEDLTEQVLSGELERGRAAVANQLINTRLRAIEVERKVKEQEEILPRLEALERARKQEGRGGRRSTWGA